MEMFLTKSWLKVLSGIFVNFAAALIIAPFIGNILSPASEPTAVVAITFDIISGIIFLSLAHECERRIENE